MAAASSKNLSEVREAEADVRDPLLPDDRQSVLGPQVKVATLKAPEAVNGVQLQSVVSKDPETTDHQVTISNECMNEDPEDEYDKGPCTRCVERLERAVAELVQPCRHLLVPGLNMILLLLYVVYFGYCMYYRFGDEDSIILLCGTLLFALILCRKLLAKRGVTCSMPGGLVACMVTRKGKRIRLFIRYGLYVITSVGLGLFMGLDILQSHPQNSQSLLGIVVLILICFLLSHKPSRVNWHPVFWGFVIQILFATLTLRTQFGYRIFKWIGDQVERLVGFSDLGSAFVLDKNFSTMGLAFSASGVIIFFNAIIFFLNHMGVIEVIVVNLGRILSVCLETGPIESVNAAANIFLGLSEAPLLIRPYLPTLSKSEICAIMTGGFASVAGGIMGLFIRMGAPANHLLTASVISAPAALAFTKLIYPETEKVNYATQTNVQMRDKSQSQSALSALSAGAVMAVKIVGPIMANMLAFVSTLGLINALLEWFGERAGVPGLSFQVICSYLLWPLSFVMGAEPADCGQIGALIGTKLFATPMVGYADLGKMIRNRKALEEYVASGNNTWYWSGSDVILEATNQTLINGVMSERSEVIATYAMCGFSAFTAIGICIGSLTAICPARRQDIIQLVVIAFFAGNMASFATASVAGLMYTEFSPTSNEE